jgi:hypothetical protein
MVSVMVDDVGGHKVGGDGDDERGEMRLMGIVWVKCSGALIKDDTKER